MRRAWVGVWIVAAAATARGQAPDDGARYRFETTSLPVPLVAADGTVDGVIEASGVEPVGDGRRFLVAHDKDPALHLVDLATGRLVGAPLAAPGFPAPGTVGPKWEGMARDSVGNLYAIGSHNGKTEDERALKGVLLRFRLRGEDGPGPTIDPASVTRWRLARSLASALQAEGLGPEAVDRRKVEGLTIREGRGADGRPTRELAIGLREPGDRVRAFVADISTAHPADAELPLRPLFAFEAEPREGVESQLTSLEYVPALGGFLVVTASEDDSNVFHGNTLWFVAGGSTDRARKLATFEVAMKAEGLAVLGAEREDGRTRVRLLITYDNDPHATHIPSRFQTATLQLDRH